MTNDHIYSSNSDDNQNMISKSEYYNGNKRLMFHMVFKKRNTAYKKTRKHQCIVLYYVIYY